MPHCQQWRDLPHKTSARFCGTEQLSRSNDLTDICRTFHPKEAKYNFFTNACVTFSKIDHMRGHKTSLNKFKKIEIISGIF